MPEQWGAAREPLDFHDLKADVQALLAISGQGSVVSFEPLDAPPPALHPGRCAAVLRDGARRRHGCPAPGAVQRALEVGPEVLLFELELALVTTAAPTRFEPVSVLPASGGT